MGLWRRLLVVLAWLPALAGCATPPPLDDERLAVEVDPAVRSRLIDSAATAIRREGREPPASLLTRVSEDAADATSSGHFGRAVAFLGIAAEAGSAGATT